MYGRAPCVWMSPQAPRQGLESCRTVDKWDELSCGCPEPNKHPLQGQEVLLTMEPSLRLKVLSVRTT